MYSLWRANLNWRRFAIFIYIRPFVFLVAIFLLGGVLLPISANATPLSSAVHKGCSSAPSRFLDDEEIRRLIGGSIVETAQSHWDKRSYNPIEQFFENGVYRKDGGRAVIMGRYKIINSLIIIDVQYYSDDYKIRHLLHCDNKYFFGFPKSKNNELIEIYIKKR